MERLAALIAEHQPEFRDLIVDELGHTKLTAEVYHSVAPTLHWNYYAQKGREHNSPRCARPTCRRWQATPAG